MFFAQTAIAEMLAAFNALAAKEDALASALIGRNFSNKIAREFAHHGAARRVRTLVQCIQNIFGNIPPDTDELPSREALIEATINIQTFIFNVAGFLDNVAWIWVYEKNVRNDDGSQLRRHQIALTSGPVLRSFSPTFRAYVKSQKRWIENLRSFRDSLAHRIPLYIAPYKVPEAHAQAYRELQQQKDASKSLQEWEALDASQKRLVVFVPEIQHSIYEQGSYPIIFHPQLFADFHTVEELTNNFLAELNSNFAAPAVRGSLIARAMRRALRAVIGVLKQVSD